MHTRVDTHVSPPRGAKWKTKYLPNQSPDNFHNPKESKGIPLASLGD